MTPIRKRMIEELQLRNYSTSTIHSYVSAVWRFTRHFHKSPELLGPEDVRQYLLHLRNDKNRAFNTLQVNRAALRFLYVRVLKRGWFDEEIPGKGCYRQLSELPRRIFHTHVQFQRTAFHRSFLA